MVPTTSCPQAVDSLFDSDSNGFLKCDADDDNGEDEYSLSGTKMAFRLRRKSEFAARSASQGGISAF